MMIDDEALIKFISNMYHKAYDERINILSIKTVTVPVDGSKYRDLYAPDYLLGKQHALEAVREFIEELKGVKDA